MPSCLRRNLAARLYPVVFERSKLLSHQVTSLLKRRHVNGEPSQTGTLLQGPYPLSSSAIRWTTRGYGQTKNCETPAIQLSQLNAAGTQSRHTKMPARGSKNSAMLRLCNRNQLRYHCRMQSCSNDQTMLTPLQSFHTQRKWLRPSSRPIGICNT